MSVLTFDVGLAHKLKKAFALNDWEEEDVNRLAESDKLRAIREVLRGNVSIAAIEHVVDCNASPYNPLVEEGWTIEEHQKSGSWPVNQRIDLFFAEDQRGDHWIGGEALRKELADESVLNANVLDYLLENPRLIPEKWKTYARGSSLDVFFWGTIYRRYDGYLYVRHLTLEKDKWTWRFMWLDSNWFSHCPAAARAN